MRSSVCGVIGLQQWLEEFGVLVLVPIRDEAFELVNAFNFRREMLVGLSWVPLILEDRPPEASQDILNLLKPILGLLELLEALYDELELRIAKHFL